jgi:hypothetical protein
VLLTLLFHRIQVPRTNKKRQCKKKKKRKKKKRVAYSSLMALEVDNKPICIYVDDFTG